MEVCISACEKHINDRHDNGLIAKKIDIEPFHCEEFHFYHKPYSIQGYKYVIGSHGFSDPNVLEKIWNKQKEIGNA